MNTSLLVCVFVAMQLPGSVSSISPTDFAAADVDGRRQLMRTAAIRIGGGDYSMLPIVEAGLRDSNAQVRFSAMGAVSEWVTHRPTSAQSVDPQVRIKLLTTLVRALSDQDFRIRGGAIKALVFVQQPLSQDVRRALVARFADESDSRVRAVIATELGVHAVTFPDSQQLLIAALDDHSPAVRRSAAAGISRFSPRDALPRIVQELRTGNQETQSEFVAALASYGAAARPYLGVLELMLSGETREDYKKQIRNAIATIRDAPGH
jgi:hypothetical protein